MTSKPEGAGGKACWFVGAVYGGTDDQTQRFLQEGIWENGYKDKYLDIIKSIKIGDRVAIKASYTRKHELPFDNRGQTVSVMAIKAIGTVVENLGDGRTLRVDWKPLDSPREWYFYTHRSTVWRVLPGDWMTDALIGFTFDGKQQDIARFRNAPYWRERFGDSSVDKRRFMWTRFYESVADQLLTFKDNREGLVKGIHEIAAKVDGLSNLQDKFSDGTTGPIKDICPFTAMGIFNRGITESNRKIIAAKLADLLGVSETIPDSFEGIPILNNQKSWLFGYEKDRQPDDIDTLWDIFEKAIIFSDTDNADARFSFIAAYDKASQRYGVGWNLTMGLYWIRPWNFPTLDGQSQSYISKKLNIQIELNGSKGRCNASDYLKVLDTLEARFQEDAYPVHSFPELSLAAWMSTDTDEVKTQKRWKVSVLNKIKELCTKKGSPVFSRQEFLDEYLEVLKDEYPNNNTVDSSIAYYMQRLRDDDEINFLGHGQYELINFEESSSDEVEQEIDADDDAKAQLIVPYSVEDIVTDGCFLEIHEVERILERLHAKKNIILQGPPGTGKTWLAKRLAFALIGQRDDKKVRAVQFHPNLSYEDFVRGWRPAGDGRLSLVDGPFIEMIKASAKEPTSRHVVVIEEINRGNPAQIFGEMLTLLEADKRTPSEALELSYRRSDDERIFIPDNLYVIGTMNIADRSLALVDLALRRRFAFIDLEPTLGKPWRDWVHSQCGIDTEILTEIENRLNALNNVISADPNLGPQFRVGHSYVTPSFGISINDAREWFRQVVDTEIWPLLDEYWFDDLDKSRKSRDLLLEGF